MPPSTVTIPLADYKRLIEAAGCDDTIATCEVCGAWLNRCKGDVAPVEDFTGCWKAATDRKRDEKTCKSYRATVME